MSELDRLIELSEFDLDYLAFDAELDSLAHLAAGISGAEVALVNLVDRYTQWTVAAHGIDIRQMPEEDSVCRYTIEGDSPLELKGLRGDKRFQDKEYVCAGPMLDYYFGIPLKTRSGSKIGALCVLHTSTLELTDKQKGLLQMLAGNVVLRLQSIKQNKHLEDQLEGVEHSKRKLVHDVRGPISGIIGIVEILKQEFKNRGLDELDEMIHLIGHSGETVLELADNIMDADQSRENAYTAKKLAVKLQQLCGPQAFTKDVELSVDCKSDADAEVLFSGRGLLQIGGNLVSNAIKFTPNGGRVTARLSIGQDSDESTKSLCLEVEDNGVGISEDKIEKILNGKSASADGTQGERGYGFGLPLVQFLVKKRSGSLDISSAAGQGCIFTVLIPI